MSSINFENITNKLTLKSLNKFVERLKLANFDCLDVLDEKFNTTTKYKIKDSEGYFYLMDSESLRCYIEFSRIPSKFFNRNPYTFENINNYFKLNNIDLELITKSPKNAKSRMTFKCLKHNIEFEKNWSDIYNGKEQCFKCVEEKLKQEPIKNFEEKLEVLNLKCLDDLKVDFNVNKKYTLIDKDGYLYNLSSSNLTSTIRKNGKLAKFFNRNPYTFKNINNYFRVHNIELELISKNPKSASCKLEFKCLKHNEIFKRAWNQVYGGCINCPICLGITNYDLEMVKDIVKSKGCEFLSTEYNGLCKDYKFKCSCGNHFTRRLDIFIHDNRTTCWECTGRHYYTYDYIKEELAKNNIELLSDTYVNTSTDIRVRYECGCECNNKMYNIRSKEYKCPYCNSKYVNEVKIANYFITNKIDFNDQFSFKDLKGVNNGFLKFDFALYNENNKLFLIEYDGEFHYYPIKGEEKFRKQQEHDRRKNEYCKSHNINLYRIPYWEQENLIEKLEEILAKEGLLYGESKAS